MTLKHPCIVNLETFFEDDANVYVVMELGGSHLYRKLKEVGKFDEQAGAKVNRLLSFSTFMMQQGL